MIWFFLGLIKLALDFGMNLAGQKGIVDQLERSVGVRKCWPTGQELGKRFLNIINRFNEHRLLIYIRGELADSPVDLSSILKFKRVAK